MAGFRINRVNEDVKRELTDIMRQLKDPRITSLLTIIKVDVSNDLSHCKVYISSLEGLEKAKEAVKGLTSANGYIKHEINSRLKMRRVPDFHFIADDSTEYSANISKKLYELIPEKSALPSDQDQNQDEDEFDDSDDSAIEE